MNLAPRLILALAIVGSFVGTISFLKGGEKDEGSISNGGVRWESSKQCKECHAEVFDEWYGSHHQIAYTNPEVRQLSDDFRKEECMDCHLPRPSCTVLLVQTDNLPLCCPFRQRRATCGESPMGRHCHMKISRLPRRPRGEPLDHRCQMRAAPAAHCEPYRRQPRPSPHPRRMPHPRRRWHICEWRVRGRSVRPRISAPLPAVFDCQNERT